MACTFTVLIKIKTIKFKQFELTIRPVTVGSKLKLKHSTFNNIGSAFDSDNDNVVCKSQLRGEILPAVISMTHSSETET